MENKINLLLKYFDNEFGLEMVEIDEWGTYGNHYIGLNFYPYYKDSIFSIDYLDLKDYFLSTANYDFNDHILLMESLEKAAIGEKLKVIEAIMNLLYKTDYLKSENEKILLKCKIFLERIGINVFFDEEIYALKNEFIKFEGYYSEVIFINETTYKKRLKAKFKSEEKWPKFFKREFDNMYRLRDSHYILQVYEYNGDESSYLMEVCESDLYDYLIANPGLNSESIFSIISDLLYGIRDVHNADIVHRDLHLGNILRKDGHFILTDFGLSKDMMRPTSFNSSNTPKNSHMFLDPIGLSDFNKLDKLSDIYSIGKIIEYVADGLTENSELKYIIEKCTNRDREKRYQSVQETINDFSSVTSKVSDQEKQLKIQEEVRNGKPSPKVLDFINALIGKNELSLYIVEKRLYNFSSIILEYSEQEQEIILLQINDNFYDATGFGGFPNYEIFSTIMYDYIKLTANANLIQIAMRILKGCSTYRGKSANQFESAKINLVTRGITFKDE